MRVGIGYDVHKLTRGRKLFLGGVEFEKAEFGLEGHSDADVLIHAVIDAMQGLAAVRTRDPKKGHVEFWVVSSDYTDFMVLLEDLKNFIFIQPVDHFDGEESEIGE